MESFSGEPRARGRAGASSGGRARPSPGGTPAAGAGKGGEVVGRPAPGEDPGRELGFEAYRALYRNSPDAVFFTVPDGRVLAANAAACRTLRMTEAEICARGRQGLSDPTDERWGELVAERERTGSVQGVARMIRGDGVAIEAEMSAMIFTGAHGEMRTCTIVRDVTERVAMERRLAEMAEQLRELALRDELTGLRNRRGFVEVGSQILGVADRQRVPAHLLFLDVDNMKEVNDRFGHSTGDAALQAVAGALTEALRRSDVLSRIGGDEFVALTLGIEDGERDVVEQRIREHLGSPGTVAAVGMPLEVSVGWAERAPGQKAGIEELLGRADRVMYQVKATKHRTQGRRATGPPGRPGSPGRPGT